MHRRFERWIWCLAHRTEQQKLWVCLDCLTSARPLKGLVCLGSGSNNPSSTSSKSVRASIQPYILSTNAYIYWPWHAFTGERQDLVQVFTEDTELRQSVQEDHLKSVPDMHRLAKRFQRGFASLQVCSGRCSVLCYEQPFTMGLIGMAGRRSCIPSHHKAAWATSMPWKP
jgi:hypothetical protein